MMSATFNSSEKDFVEMHLLIQFVIGIKISFLANLVMAGDISPLEIFLMSIFHLCVSKFCLQKQIQI